MRRNRVGGGTYIGWTPVLLALGLGALGAQAGEISETVQVGPAPAWVRPAQLPAETGGSSDAAFKVLLNDQQLNFSAQGDSAYAEIVTKVEKPEGLAKVGSLTLNWN